MTVFRAQLLARYASGFRDFTKLRLYMIDLEGQDFKGIDLSFSILEGYWNEVSLMESQLSSTILNDCDFRGVNLTRANMPEAIFNQCDLTGCNFAQAVLNGTEFRQTGAYAVNFTQADLRGVLFEETDLNGSNFTGADLRGAKNIDIESLDYFGCTLSNTRMPDGRFYP